jgi:anti-anti-sigma factor
MTDLASIDLDDRGDGIRVARITGDIDLSNVAAVSAALLDAMSHQAGGLVVDCTGLRFIDSSGVEALLRVERSLSARRQRLAVVIPPEAPTRRALELSGAESPLSLHATVDEAIAALGTEPGQEPAA